MEFLAKNVRKRECNWVGSWVTLPESLSVLREADKRKFFDHITTFLSKRYGFGNYRGGVRPHG